MEHTESVLYIDINLLQPSNYQSRKVFNEESLKELASSIKEYGIINPILVRKKDNMYEIIAGERRLKAAKMAGLTKVPVIVKEIDEAKAKEMALVENLQRENISPIEEAKSYQSIISSSSINETKLSEKTGKSPNIIANKLKLLSLPPNIQDALTKRKISEQHAKSLLNVEDSEKQAELLERVINERLSVKELNNIINEKQITEEEIKTAINDIMKSLNIEEKKEEKESDNMNNGNFFPNYNINSNSSGASLNTMNMQTMNPNPTPMPNPMPEATSIPSFGPTENMENQQPPVMPTPSFNQPSAEPLSMPDINMPQSSPNDQMASLIPQPEMVMPTPEAPAVDIPLFSEPTQPVEPPIPETPNMEVAEATPIPAVDTPLFNQNVDMNNPVMAPEIPNPIEQPYEVPVETPQVAEPDKLTQVTNLLNSNGIEYKAYSNETGHCIIIEL